ncbi:MAG: NifU family protein [Bdellovibrionales bacterium]|nr:NifU family protein [Bdellovibrionales bacterium]
MSAQKATTFLKIEIRGRNAKEYLVNFMLEEKQSPTEKKVDLDKFSVLYSKEDESKLTGSTIEWIESVSGSGFQLKNPNKPESNLDSPLAARVQEILDAEINPSIAAHGGNIELLDIIDQKAYVKMSGGCQGCSSAKATLKHGVEARIKELIPEILELVDTTDHAGGSNPYYS